MESITATENELKELMEQSFFVRAEPVKKGEGSYGIKTNLGSQILSVIKNNKLIYDVGEVFSVKNKKGEKQCFCPECKSSWSKGTKKFACKHIFVTKPLLVRLDKIEEQIVFSVEKHYFETDLKNPDNRYCSRYRHLKKEINFKPKVNQEVWLQNFRRIE